jgi:N6-adenosine-specific RNA methylase IME4
MPTPPFVPPEQRRRSDERLLAALAAGRSVSQAAQAAGLSQRTVYRRLSGEKPAGVYELIECAWPEASKLELFARHARPGWAAWGNQLGAAS